jgi:hypothetical protein
VESDSGNRYREVVQSDEGLWLRAASERWQRCVRPYLRVERARLSTLNYEVVSNKGKESAENIKVKQLQRPLRNEKPRLIGGAFIYAADSSDDHRQHARQRRAHPQTAASVSAASSKLSRLHSP